MELSKEFSTQTLLYLLLHVDYIGNMLLSTMFDYKKRHKIHKMKANSLLLRL